MRALSVVPGQPNSAAVIDVPDPTPGEDELLVEALAVGVCGTDKEIVAGDYGWAQPGRERLVIGHESLGRVRQVPAASKFAVGDLVVGVVRRPDPVPCGACAHGEFDMCRNGRYTERGIKELDGYASDLWSIEQEYAVRLDPALSSVGMLMEPTSVVAKAWDQIDKVGSRSWFEPSSVLVTGAGPIGLLAAMIGVQRGLDVHVLDKVTEAPKPRLVAALGATYHVGDLEHVVAHARPDIIIEATGVSELVFAAMKATTSYGIVCLTGVSPVGRRISVDGGTINRDIVLENDAIIGSVNANLGHYNAAADAMARADLDWLRRLISRRVALSDFAEALQPRPDDVKVVIELRSA